MACPMTKRLFQQASKSHKIAQQFGRCVYCGCRLVTDPRKSKSKRFATFDHVEAKAFDPRPGWLQAKFVACQECNTLKGSLPLIVFMLRLSEKKAMQAK